MRRTTVGPLTAADLYLSLMLQCVYLVVFESSVEDMILRMLVAPPQSTWLTTLVLLWRASSFAASHESTTSRLPNSEPSPPSLFKHRQWRQPAS